MLRPLLLVVLGTTSISAQPRHDDWDLETPDARSMREHLTNKLGALSGGIGFHVERLSFSAIDLGFDVRTKRANLALGNDPGNSFGLRFASQVQFERGYARVDASLDLALFGERYRLELPAFDLASNSVHGERAVELRIPFVHGRF